MRDQGECGAAKRAPDTEPESVSLALKRMRQATLRRHTLKVGAICLIGLVRICAGALSNERPYRDHPLSRP